MKKIKVFIGFTEVAGYFTSLKKGFEANGIQCTLVDIPQHQFKYSKDNNNSIIVKSLILVNNSIKNKAKANHGYLLRIVKIYRKFLLFLLFIWALFKHNVFIFTFAGKFFNYSELKLLNILNKKVIYIFSGSDHRPPYINGSWIKRDNGQVYSFEQCFVDTSRIKNNVKKIEKYSDYIIGHHLSAHFHEKPFVPFAFVGIPYEIKRVSTFVSAKKKTNVRVLHAPSMKNAKGTSLVRDAIETLKSRGHNIDYIELYNVSNNEVLREIRQCDFVIDEVFSDARMAGFATEAASCGKPAVVCGYADNNAYSADGQICIPPVFYDCPENLINLIEKVIVNHDLRRDVGKKCKLFIEQQWDRQIVVKKYLQMFDNRFPASDLFIPSNIKYLNGFGLTKQESKEYLKGYINKYGVKSLNIGDKKNLENEFLKFIGTE